MPNGQDCNVCQLKNNHKSRLIDFMFRWLIAQKEKIMTTEFFSTKFSRTPIVRAVDNSHDSITVARSAPIMDRPIAVYQFMVRKGAPNGPQVTVEELPKPSNFPPYRHEINSLASQTLYYIQVRGIDSAGDASSWSRQQGYKTQ